jgi:hypothetical protein
LRKGISAELDWHGLGLVKSPGGWAGTTDLSSSSPCPHRCAGRVEGKKVREVKRRWSGDGAVKMSLLPIVVVVDDVVVDGDGE